MPQTKASIQQAGKLLSDELLKDSAKKIWAQYLPQKISSATDIISYRAIARAIAQAEYRKYGVEHEANRYKDRVRRAILGQSMTAETLALFAETFNFSDQLMREISDLIASSVPDQPQKSKNTTHLRYDITSSFYDIFLDRDLSTYRLVCTLMIRSKQHELDGVWAPLSNDVSEIKLLAGGQSVYDENRGMYHFLFDYPLADTESTEICYSMTVKQDVEQIGLFSLRYFLDRENCFFRLNFDQPATAPQELTVLRRSDAEGAENSEEKVENIKVHDGHASIYLNSVYRERIIFALSDAEK